MALPYKKIVTFVTLSLLVASPMIVLANIDPGPAPNALADLSATDIMNKIFDFIWPIFIGIAVLMLLIAGFAFLTAQGDAEKVAGARLSVLWIIVGIVIGMLAFSIPFVVRNTLGF